MRRFRCTIASLAAAVASIALAVAALREATAVWDSITFTLTLGLLVISILLAVHRSGERRAFWLGCALAGSVYLGASLLPTVEPRLLSSKGLAYLDSKISNQMLVRRVLLRWPQTGSSASTASARPLALEAGQLWADVDGADVLLGTTLMGSARTSQSFTLIGHSIIALFLACAAGFFSRRLARARSEAGRVGALAALHADRVSETNR